MSASAIYRWSFLLAFCALGCAAPKNGGSDLLAPSHDRDWIPNHAVLPKASIKNGKIKVQNVRNTRYLSDDDYIVQHYDATYNLNELETVDFVRTVLDSAPHFVGRVPDVAGPEGEDGPMVSDGGRD